MPQRLNIDRLLSANFYFATMNSQTERVAYLFNRYYSKTATDAERKELFLLVGELSDERLTGLMAQAYNAETETLPELDKTKAAAQLAAILKTYPLQAPVQKAKTVSLWGRIAVAASLLLIVGSVVYLIQTKKTEPVADNTPKQTMVAKDAEPGTNKAILTLGDGSTIVLNDAGKGTLTKQGNIEISKTADGQIVYKVKGGESASDAVTINKVSTPRGGQFQVVLPDGSKAWLNAASSLSFPTAFNGDKREVTMTGEVYFEIEKNKTPFVVASPKGNIEVLGTHFNIMAYEDEKAMETTLLEGSIKLQSGDASRILKPGQQAVSPSLGDIRMASRVDVDEVMAWKNGLFHFGDGSIQSVMRQVSRWYDLDVVYEGTMPQKEIAGKISRNVKASEVLSMLNYTGINFKIEGKKIIVTP